MKKHLATLLVVLLVIAMLPMTASAATHTVTVAVGDGPNSLPAALLAAQDGDVIKIVVSITDINGNNATRTINHNLTIEGDTNKPTLSNVNLTIGGVNTTLSLDSMQLGGGYEYRRLRRALCA